MPPAHATSARRTRRRTASPLDVTDPAQAARAVGLRYVTDAVPGIQRKRTRHGFIYSSPDGQPLRDQEELERIASLAIPPAWTDVWICPNPRGHMQATGRDDRGRKQYRYHVCWRAVRDESKYHRMIAFGEALPLLRRRVDEDLALPGLPREKVLATVVRLLDLTRIRVGNEEYARENASFGLTTLRNDHVEVDGARLRFQFRGKSGKEHTVEVRDRRLARIVKRCQDLPGHELFQYGGDDGLPHKIESDDVNAYLRQICGEDFTAKDFRTWSGTVLAARALGELGEHSSQTEARKNVTQAIKSTARQLGNTPAVCRKSYIHPDVLDAYQSGTLLRAMKQQVAEALRHPRNGVEPEEAAVLAFLRTLEAGAGGAADTRAG